MESDFASVGIIFVLSIMLDKVIAEVIYNLCNYLPRCQDCLPMSASGTVIYHVGVRATCLSNTISLRNRPIPCQDSKLSQIKLNSGANVR